MMWDTGDLHTSRLPTRTDICFLVLSLRYTRSYPLHILSFLLRVDIFWLLGPGNPFVCSCPHTLIRTMRYRFHPSYILTYACHARFTRSGFTPTRVERFASWGGTRVITPVRVTYFDPVIPPTPYWHTPEWTTHLAHHPPLGIEIIAMAVHLM